LEVLRGSEPFNVGIRCSLLGGPGVFLKLPQRLIQTHFPSDGLPHRTVIVNASRRFYIWPVVNGMMSGVYTCQWTHPIRSICCYFSVLLWLVFSRDVIKPLWRHYYSALSLITCLSSYSVIK